jgi:hypothetical protein
MGIVRVSAARFRSTRLNTLSASPARGPPFVVIVGLVAAAGTAFGRGRRLVLVKSVGLIDPTFVYK